MIHAATRKRLSRAVPILLRWHQKNRRSFIWRSLDRSPYIVLVSEFMLQQTGARQVEKKLPEFLRRFPSMETLAHASKRDVLRAWQGLGYNRRALQLHRAAQAIYTLGTFPTTLEGLRELPGVGRYTASAILCFSNNADVPVVDVNIERVLSRVWRPKKPAHLEKIYELDAAILPKGSSSSWHEALMDFGSAICTKRAPKCSECPLSALCRSAENITNESSPKNPERRYWGEPRRIWRGRILKIVANSEPISSRKLYSLVKKQFHLNDSAFAPFVTSILQTLEREGFIIESKKEGYSLAHE